MPAGGDADGAEGDVRAQDTGRTSVHARRPAGIVIVEQDHVAVRAEARFDADAVGPPRDDPAPTLEADGALARRTLGEHDLAARVEPLVEDRVQGVGPVGHARAADGQGPRQRVRHAEEADGLGEEALERPRGHEVLEAGAVQRHYVRDPAQAQQAKVGGRPLDLAQITLGKA